MQNAKFSTKAMLLIIFLVHAKKIAFSLGFAIAVLVVYAFFSQFVYPEGMPLHAYALALVAGIAVGDTAALLVKESDSDIQQSDE